MRAWCQREFAEHAIHFTPLQANMGFSARKGTLRGLHYQVAPALEAKLVRCTRGAIFDVVVDLRPTSPTYMSWYGSCLSSDNGRMLYLPEGCAHGASQRRTIRKSTTWRQPTIPPTTHGVCGMTILQSESDGRAGIIDFRTGPRLATVEQV